MKVLSWVFALSVLAGFSNSASARDAMGFWMGEDGLAKMHVAPCGGGTICAKIVWLRAPNDKHGKPLIDDNNGDAGLRNRPIIGLPVAFNMKKTGNKEWTGRVYDPKRGGQTYTGYMVLQSNDRMQVKGCLGIYCESEYWQRTTKE